MKIFGNYLTNEQDKSIYEKIENQLQNADNVNIYYGYPIIDIDGNKNFVKAAIITLNGIYLYQNNLDEKKIYKRFIVRTIMESPSISEIYEENADILNFFNKDQVDEVIDKINSSKNILNHEQFSEINAIIQKSFGLTNPDNREILKDGSLGNLIKRRSNQLNTFDENQFGMVYEDTNTHLRIRGLAGSGKTILLVKKMAYLHYIHPEYKMAYVFYTISLKQFIQNLFIRFYKDFDKFNEPNFDNIKILHSWGGNKAEGFYSSLCKNFNVEKKTIADVFSKNNKFGIVCNDLLENIKHLSSTGVYDKIFIDEAQDFPIEFFNLAKNVLNPSGNIFYAYDELQSLNEVDISMPTKKEIFGDEPCNDVNLKVCYRTPNEILVTAHALGLGIYNIENGKTKWANMIQDLSTWESIGYEIKEGQLKYGSAVTLQRKKQNFEQINNPIEFSIHENDIEQYQYISSEIYRLITEEDVKPEDILIIDLNSLSINEDYPLFKNEFYKYFTFDEDKNDYLANVNIVNKDNGLKFRVPNSIPFTTIFRAKGNEANIVFILNTHSLTNVYSYARNRIFTAMTRSKFKVYLSGQKTIQKYIDEYNLVKQNNFELTFTYPTVTELKELKTIAKQESLTATNIEQLVEKFKGFKGNNELLREILLAQTGQSDIDGLITFIENIFGDGSNE